MRPRDEVLREWSYSDESECTWLELKLIDRIRELEALVDTLTARNLDLSIECDGLEDELRHATTPTRGSDE